MEHRYNGSDRSPLTYVPMPNVPQVFTEAQIQAQIRRILFPNGIRCPRCQKRYSRKVAGRYFCNSCRLKFSLKRATPFARSKLSYHQLWLLLQCWLKELSPQDAHAMTELSHTTIRRWYRRFNGLVPQERILLGGTVEVDEAFIGKQRHANQQIVVGAVERCTDRVVFQPIPNRESESLDPFLLDHVDRASMVCTDAHAGYESITEFFGYGHTVVNHSMGHFGPTNHIENVWMRLRRFIRKVYHHVWKEHLPRLLHEFQARINHPEAFLSPRSFLSHVFHVS